MNNKVCVLTSGGMDSTACLHYYCSHKYITTSLFIDYGQKSAKQELNAAKNISKYFGIDLKILILQGSIPNKKDYIRSRNAFLLTTAFMEIQNVNFIAIGIHSSTNYSDCSKLFIQKIQDLFDIYEKGSVQLLTPFIEWAKKDIWNYVKCNLIPHELTYSCEYGEIQPCGKCTSCKDLEELNVSPI